MERIYIGVNFSNENVKEKFLNTCVNKLNNVSEINENGKLFTFINAKGDEQYFLYEFPLLAINDFSPSKLETILFVADDGWIEFDEMFNGVKDAKIDNIVFLYTGNQYNFDELKESSDVGAYLSGVYAKCLAKQFSLDDINKNELTNFFYEIKDHIHSFPFVINNLSYSQLCPKSIKCSGDIDAGFLQKGDRITIHSKGGKEIVGKIVTVFAFSFNPMLNAKKGQSVRMTVELEQESVLEGKLLRAISTDKAKKAKKFNALITMYDAEFEGYRTLDINCDLVFDIFGKNRDGFISRQGCGYIDGDEQAFKTLSSGNSDIFSLEIIEPLPLVVGTSFIVEKSWTASGDPATYGYGTIIE